MEIHKPKFIKGFIAEIFVIVIGISLAVTAERIVESFPIDKCNTSCAKNYFF